MTKYAIRFVFASRRQNETVEGWIQDLKSGTDCVSLGREGKGMPVKQGGQNQFQVNILKTPSRWSLPRWFALFEDQSLTIYVLYGSGREHHFRLMR